MALRGFRTPTRVAWLTLLAGGACTFGMIDSCDDRLLEVTRYVDPCGTFLTCAPGSFEVASAEVGDYTVDPSCTVPGQCGDYQPLGTITDLDP